MKSIQVPSIRRLNVRQLPVSSAFSGTTCNVIATRLAKQGDARIVPCAKTVMALFVRERLLWGSPLQERLAVSSRNDASTVYSAKKKGS